MSRSVRDICNGNIGYNFNFVCFSPQCKYKASRALPYEQRRYNEMCIYNSVRDEVFEEECVQRNACADAFMDLYMCVHICLSANRWMQMHERRYVCLQICLRR